MQIQEVFEVEAAPAAVWPFFGQVERVARCVKSVEVLGPERYKVVASQEVGCISATFELTTSLSRPGPGAFVGFTSLGKGIASAVGTQARPVLDERRPQEITAELLQAGTIVRGTLASA